MPDYNPFKGLGVDAPAPMRVLHAFHKGEGRAELRERIIASLNAREFLIFVGGSLHSSELFHGARLSLYAAAVEERVRRFKEHGWSVSTSLAGSSEFAMMATRVHGQPVPVVAVAIESNGYVPEDA